MKNEKNATKQLQGYHTDLTFGLRVKFLLLFLGTFEIKNFERKY